MLTFARIASAIALMGAAMAAADYAIPADKVDYQKIYWGKPTQFKKPAEVQNEQVIKATPEYQQLLKKKIQRGTGEYWLLMSKASDRAMRVIAKVGESSEYDLITAQGYLGSLEPAIPATDITEQVVKYLADEAKRDK